MALVSQKTLSFGFYIGLCVAAALWILIASSAIYGIFWWFYMPKQVLRSGVSVDFDVGPGASSLIAIPKFGLESQDYGVALELTLPRSPSNVHRGNFMVELGLCNSTQSEHCGQGPGGLTVRKMGLLPYKSELIEMLDAFVFSPLYILGFRQQESTVKIDLIESIRAPKWNYHSALISINQPIELASAEIVWTAKLRGLSYWMYHHPLPTFFVSVGFLWTFGVFVAITAALLVNAKLSYTPESPAPPPKKVRPTSHGRPIKGAVYTVSRNHALARRKRIRYRNLPKAAALESSYESTTNRTDDYTTPDTSLGSQLSSY